VVVVLIVVAIAAWFMIDNDEDQPQANGQTTAQGDLLITSTQTGDAGSANANQNNTTSRGSVGDGRIFTGSGTAGEGSNSGPTTGGVSSGTGSSAVSTTSGNATATGSGSSGSTGTGSTAYPKPEPAVGSASRTPASTRALIDQGRQLVQQGELIAGRAKLNAALAGPISPADASALRKELAALNETLVFSPRIEPNDPFSQVHVVQAGQMLANIARQYDVPWRFLARINRISDPRLLRQGARLKVIKGPFHVVVDKDDFRLDVYLRGQDGDMYIKSFPVGLGEYNSTPVGQFVVRRHSKLVNPEWTNPRTGERYLADNPENPIGEYWVGLRGVDANTEVLSGYGLHGTIEPQSIGRESSMGCVRLLPQHIEELYAMLIEEDSTVRIVP
jgi:LysM repeat protein